MAAVGRSTALAATVAGGVLPRAAQQAPGAGFCTTLSAICTETPIRRVLVFQCVVCGINRLFDLFSFLFF